MSRALAEKIWKPSSSALVPVYFCEQRRVYEASLDSLSSSEVLIVAAEVPLVIVRRQMGRLTLFTELNDDWQIDTPARTRITERQNPTLIAREAMRDLLEAEYSLTARPAYIRIDASLVTNHTGEYVGIDSQATVVLPFRVEVPSHVGPGMLYDYDHRELMSRLNEDIASAFRHEVDDSSKP